MMDREEIPLKKGEKVKYRVHVRALRTKINVPKKGFTVFERGHVFEKPWAELVDLAGMDKKNRVLRLEILKEEGSKK